MELHYAFLKDNRVVQVAVFASKDEALADSVAQNMGYDDAVWLGETVVPLWSTYDGKDFTQPTDEYLIFVGAMSPKSKIVKPELNTEPDVTTE